MEPAQQKIVQYLNEAHASEHALVRVLQSQIAMTPSGSYRSGLEKHLEETHGHAQRVKARAKVLDEGMSPVNAAVGMVEDLVGQAIALSKTPLDLLRGTSGDEKVLKNAKDACATEALEIATYTAIERLAKAAGDDETARLAASIRADEERMLAQILREIPKLTDAMVGADVNGDPSYDITETGAADAIRATAKATNSTAKKAATTAKRTSRQARKVPGVAQVEGQVKGTLASEKDLAISGYDGMTADQITAKLPDLSQVDLAKIDAYERRNHSRTTVLNRIAGLRRSEPWAGYDELTVAEIQSVLGEGDAQRAQQVRTYERAHKNRTGVLNATEHTHANA